MIGFALLIIIGLVFAGLGLASLRWGTDSRDYAIEIH